MTTSNNSGYTASVLRTFAQIRHSWTSHVRKPLGERAEKSKGGKVNDQHVKIF